jgi:hypothetical protein
MLIYNHLRAYARRAFWRVKHTPGALILPHLEKRIFPLWKFHEPPSCWPPRRGKAA